jgi:hypothetical protein
MPRKSDSQNEKMYFQVDRFIQQNGEWFYMTREGDEQGPFLTKDDAQDDLFIMLMTITKREQFGQVVNKTT